VLTVLVNGIEIPAGVAGTNMTATGWYNVPTLGTRTGAFNMDFTDGGGKPAGDPYGSMGVSFVGGAESDQRWDLAAQGRCWFRDSSFPYTRPQSTAFWQQAYLDMAGIMAAAGLQPYLQFGEVQWWYFAAPSGMPFYDSYTQTTFQAAHGRPMATIASEHADPAQYPDECASFRPWLAPLRIRSCGL
jgi:hypothetical protein